MIRKLATVALLSVLAACSFAPKDTGRAFMFALIPAPAVPHKQAGESLIVALPTAAPELDTYRIALTHEGQRWDYYAGARWSDFLPMLVQDNVTKTLEEAGEFKSVTTDQTGAHADRVLKIEIRTFQAEYEAGIPAPFIRVRLSVSLKRRIEGTTISSFEVRGDAKAARDKLPEIQAAFARAFKDAQKQMVDKLDAALAVPK